MTGFNAIYNGRHKRAYKFDEFSASDGDPGVIAPRRSGGQPRQLLALGDTIIECYGKIIRQIWPQLRPARERGRRHGTLNDQYAENDTAVGVQDDAIMAAVMGKNHPSSEGVLLSVV